MKKILACLMLGFIISSHGFSQEKNADDCNDLKPQIRKVLQRSDSLSRFFLKLKETGSPSEWKAFEADLGNDRGLQSFDNFEGKADQYREEYHSAMNGYITECKALVNQVDPDNAMPDEELDKRMKEIFDCYYADKDENNLVHLLTSAGRLAPDEIGNEVPGPCEANFQATVTAAKAIRDAAVNNCILGGGSIWGLIRKLVGLIPGGACIINAHMTYNNTVWNAMITYGACTQGQ